MEKTVLLLLALSLFAATECRRSLRSKRASIRKTESYQVCIEGLDCFTGRSNAVDNETLVWPKMGNLIAQLVEKTGVQVEDIHINQTLDVQMSGKQMGPLPPVVEKKLCRPMDCQEVIEHGHNKTGVYEVWPRSRVTAGRPIRVRCDMDTDGGGWTIIQRRGNFSLQEDFNRDWKSYKNGFGNLGRDYWIGNDNIFAMSNQGAYSARFDMMDAAGNTAYELYEDFWIGDETSNYTLHISNSSGTAGDSMTYYNGLMFSTMDVDNDKTSNVTCAVMLKSGFWWNKCSRCNPNGVYQPGHKKDFSVMHYYSWRKGIEGLYAMEIKLKRL